MIKNVFFAALFTMAVFSNAEAMEIDDLVNQFQPLTDVQRDEFRSVHYYENISVSGVVMNVEPWNMFDERTDMGMLYYRVVTAQKTSSKGVPYEILIFYKDKSKVEGLSEGSTISVTGPIIKILDQRLLFSVWVYAGELTAEDKTMFSAGID
jgi:hypothetical protein